MALLDQPQARASEQQQAVAAAYVHTAQGNTYFDQQHTVTCVASAPTPVASVWPMRLTEGGKGTDTAAAGSFTTR